MKKLLFILALLFAGCCEETENKTQCFSMTLSDALPVQFWLNNCETYNEKIVCGINHFCFCQPFECDDQIKIQFTDAFTDYVTEEVIVPITLPALSSWLTTSLSDAWYNWTLGATPSVNLPGTGGFGSGIAGSEYLYTDYAFEAGKQYSITINYTYTINSGSSNPRTASLAILDSGNNVISSGTQAAASGANSLSHSFTASAATTRIGFRFSSGSNVDITVTSTSGTRTDIVTTYPDPVNYDLVVYDQTNTEVERIAFDAQLLADSFTYVYSTAWIPSESDICDQQVSFEIFNDDTDTVVAKSDCIEVRETWECTNLISYSNNRNYTGLVYADVSPDPEFSIRVPSRFFHERNDEEDEVMALSSSFVTLSSSIQAQKLFEVIHGPYYWHRKIQLILKHDNVDIENQLWVKQDAYEINEGNKRGSLKSAQVWLTQKDNLQRNVI
jgi:hypothetical protein